MGCRCLHLKLMLSYGYTTGEHMQITLTIPEDMLARVDAAAARHGLSRSAFIRFRTAGASALEPLPDVEEAISPWAGITLDDQDAIDWLGWRKNKLDKDGASAQHAHALIKRLLARGPGGAEPDVEAPPSRARGTADAPPAGYVLVTIEERDVGKDGWMSPQDAGV